MTANIYERLLLGDSIESYLINNEVIPEFLQGDILERPFDPTHEFSNQIRVKIPEANATLGDCLIWLPVVPAEPPSRGTSITVNTESDGSGTDFTIKTGSVALDYYDVRVYNSYPFLDFAAAQAGNTVYVTVAGGESRWNAQIVRRLTSEIREIEDRLQYGSSIRRIKAHTGLPMGSVVSAQADGDDLVTTYGSNVQGNHPVGIVTSATESGEMAPVLSSGILPGFGGEDNYRERQSMGRGTWIYASKADGGWTYFGDTDSYFSLDEEDMLVPIGQYLGNGYLNVCVGHPVSTMGAYPE